MAFYRSGNPALSRVARMEEGAAANPATYKGIARKAIFLVALTIGMALLSFVLPFLGDVPYETISALLVVSLIVALVCSVIAMLAPGSVKVTGSLYAAAEGFVIGFLALVLTISGYGGEVFTALLATAIVFLVMMFLYAKGIVKVGNRFKSFMLATVLGILAVNLLVLLLGLINPDIWTVFYGNGLFAVVLSGIMVVVASLMILVDLSRMTEIVEAGLDKKYEWYAAYGLLVTLIWLYMEFLRLFLRLSQYFKK